MSFVSVEFAILLVAVLLSLALIRSIPLRKVIVLCASCLFYAYWDWRFLGLIASVTIADYTLARYMVNRSSLKTKRLLLLCSLLINLGLLGVFKYANFFIGTLDAFLQAGGFHLATLNIILPIGISFYIFETISYVMDIYRGAALPAASMLDYAIFVTFFPRLVAGPIMRAKHFLPQLEKGFQVESLNVFIGLQLFLRGLVKKLVIADNLAIIADQIYAAPALYAPATVWLGVLAYSIQILCDFAGYTDMAVGIGRMLGIDLPKNFDLPYASLSVTEFWQRWHISLSTWLRDYLYIPLGGNRGGRARTYLNLMVTMLLGGLWHGASWNFVLWGGLHGSYLAAERALGLDRQAKQSIQPAIAWFRAVLTFLLVSVTWVFFRSPSFDTTVLVLKKLFLLQSGGFQWFSVPAFVVICIFVFASWLASSYRWTAPFLRLKHSYTPALILLQLLLIYYLSPMKFSPFIYFQF